MPKPLFSTLFLCRLSNFLQLTLNYQAPFLSPTNVQVPHEMLTVGIMELTAVEGWASKWGASPSMTNVSHAFTSRQRQNSLRAIYSNYTIKQWRHSTISLTNGESLWGIAKLLTGTQSTSQMHGQAQCTAGIRNTRREGSCISSRSSLKTISRSVMYWRVRRRWNAKKKITRTLHVVHTKLKI